MQDGEKDASKRAAKALAVNCAVLPYIFALKTAQNHEALCGLIYFITFQPKKQVFFQKSGVIYDILSY